MLPQHFPGEWNWNEFEARLLALGFSRLTSGAASGGFHHSDFKEHQRDLLEKFRAREDCVAPAQTVRAAPPSPAAGAPPPAAASISWRPARSAFLRVDDAWLRSLEERTGENLTSVPAAST